MTVHSQAQATTGRAVREAARSRTLSRLARAGFLGYGLVHALVAWLALEIAFGSAPEEGDQSGAFALLARTPAGKAVLVLMAVGLAAMAVWQALTAATGHPEHEAKERITAGARAVVYAALVFAAGKAALGSGSSSAAKQQNATAGALGNSGGRALVIVVGVVVFAIGAGLVVYGLTRKFEKKLETDQMGPRTRRAARWLGTIGYPGKGVAYAIVGGLLVAAAVTFDPDKARGLDAALRTLAAQPDGWLLLTLVALGFLAFGGYCVVQARYRRT